MSPKGEEARPPEAVVFDMDGVLVDSGAHHRAAWRMYSLLGPTVETAVTIALSEWLRIVFGVKFIGMAETIYGLLLVIFIIFLPAGIYGSLAQLVRRRRRVAPAPAPA